MYGIEEEVDENKRGTGRPKKIVGLKGLSPDSETLRLEEKIRQGISPRLQGVETQVIEDFEEGPVLVIHVPRSWQSPHMVTFKNYSRFFARSSAGKYQLDVDEIRTAFIGSADISQRMREYQLGRIATVNADEGPVHLIQYPKVFLHLIPFESMLAPKMLNIGQLPNAPHFASPLYADGMPGRYNIDGLLSSTGENREGPSHGYVQLFRTGTIEAVSAGLIRTPRDERNEEVWFRPILVERELIKGVKQYLGIQKQLDVKLPVVMLIAMTGVRDMRMYFQQFLSPSHPFDRETVMLPDIVVDDWNEPSDILLRPAFDAIWQAAGLRNCPHYRDDDRWHQPR